MRRIKIADKTIGDDAPCYVIAEVSCNHNGDYDEARRIIEAAAMAGADAVKLQTYTADTITRDFKGALEGTIWAGMDLHKLYNDAHTPWSWHEELAKVAADKGLHLFSSPFDETAVDFLMEQNVPAFKVASFEAVDNKLMEYIAKTGKPVIVSNGMTDFLEMKEAVDTLRGGGARDLAILHCNSGYPADFAEANLKTIPAIRELFGCPAGLSDHTLFIDAENKAGAAAHIAPVEAVKLGAKVLEVHLMMDRAEARALFEKGKGGFDWPFSREPDELKRAIEMIRAVEAGEDVVYDTEDERKAAESARGEVCFEPTKRELDSRPARPALWIVEDIKMGELFRFAGGRDGNVDSIRPGNGGLHMRFADFIDGRKAARDLQAGAPLTWDMIKINEEKS